jgi:hypothetical protein
MWKIVGKLRKIIFSTIRTQIVENRGEIKENNLFDNKNTNCGK